MVAMSLARICTLPPAFMTTLLPKALVVSPILLTETEPVRDTPPDTDAPAEALLIVLVLVAIALTLPVVAVIAPARYA